MKKIILATANEHKLQEIRCIIKDLSIRVLSLADFGLEAPEETGDTFVDNALLKARFVLEHTNIPVLADDSGLIVEALNGEPGIRSGRYAGERATDQDNRNKLQYMLQQSGVFKSKAKYHCCVVLINPQNKSKPIIRSGYWIGEIRTTCSGNNGFGYDPMFYLPKLQCTVAELSQAEKNQLSHRSKAINKLKQYLL